MKIEKAGYCFALLLLFAFLSLNTAIAGNPQFSDWQLRIYHQPCLTAKPKTGSVIFDLCGKTYPAPVLQEIYLKGLEKDEGHEGEDCHTTFFLTSYIGAVIVCGDQPAMRWGYGKRVWSRPYLDRTFIEQDYIDEYLVDDSLDTFRIFFIDSTVNDLLKEPQETKRQPMKLVLCLNHFTAPKPDNDPEGMYLYKPGAKGNQQMLLEIDLSKDAYLNLPFDSGYPFEFSPQESYVLVKDKKYPLPLPDEPEKETVRRKVKKRSKQDPPAATCPVSSESKDLQVTEAENPSDAVVFAFFEPPRNLPNGMATPWISRFWLIDHSLIKDDETKREKVLKKIESDTCPEFFRFYSAQKKLIWGGVNETEVGDLLREVSLFFNKHYIDEKKFKITVDSGEKITSNLMEQGVNLLLQLLIYYVNKCSGYETETINPNLSELNIGKLSVYPLADFAEVFQGIERHHRKLSIRSYGEYIKNIYFLGSHLVARFVYMNPSENEWSLIKKISMGCLCSGHGLPQVLDNEVVLAELLLQAAHCNEKDTFYLTSFMALLPLAAAQYIAKSGCICGWSKQYHNKYSESHRYIWQTIRAEKQNWIDNVKYANGQPRDFARLDYFISHVQQMPLLELSETLGWVEELSDWKTAREKGRVRKEKASKARLDSWDTNLDKLVARIGAAETKKAKRLREQRDRPRRKKKPYYSDAGSTKKMVSVPTKSHKPPVCTDHEDEPLTDWEKQYQVGAGLYKNKKYAEAANHFRKLLGKPDTSRLDDARVYSVLVDCEKEPLRAKINQLDDLCENAEKLQATLAIMTKGQRLIKKEKLNRPAEQLSALTKCLHPAMKAAGIYQVQAITNLNMHLYLLGDNQDETVDAAALLALIEDETQNLKTSLKNMKSALQHLIYAYKRRFELWKQRDLVSARPKSHETRIRMSLEAEQKDVSRTVERQHAASDTCSLNPADGEPFVSDAEPETAEDRTTQATTEGGKIKLDCEDDPVRRAVGERISAIETVVEDLTRKLKGADELREKLVSHQPLPDKALLGALNDWFDQKDNQKQVRPATQSAESAKACTPNLLSGSKLRRLAAKGIPLPTAKNELSGEMTTFFEQHRLTCIWGQQDSLSLLSVLVSVMCSEQYPLTSFKRWAQPVMPDVESLFTALGASAEQLSRTFPSVIRLRENADAFTVSNPVTAIWRSEQLLPFLIVPWSGHSILVFVDGTGTNPCGIRRYGMDGEISPLALTTEGLSFDAANIMLLVKDDKYWAAVMPAAHKVSQ